MRVGTFSLDRKFVLGEADEETSPLEKVFEHMRFVPIKVSPQGYPDKIKFTGMSHVFESIDEGAVTPEYRLIINRGDDGMAVFDRAERVE